MTFQLAVLSASHPWSCCPSKKIFCCSSAHQCNYSWGIWFISQLLKTRMLRHSLIGGASQWWCWCVSINSVSCAITRRSKKGRQTKSSMNTPPTTSHSSNLHRIPPQLCKQILVADVLQEVPPPANNKLITFWRSKNLSFVWQTNLSGKSLQPQHFNKNVMPINKRFARPISHNNASSFTLRLKLLNDYLPSQRCLRLLRHSILHYPPSSTNQNCDQQFFTDVAKRFL
jgi:hypothetical protein